MQAPGRQQFDPFDELAAAPRISQSGVPLIAPDSTLGPLGLDPLADLWQPSGSRLSADGSVPSAASSQPQTFRTSFQQVPVSQLQSQQPSFDPGFDDPWDLESLGRPSNPQLTSTQQQPTLGQGRSTAQSSTPPLRATPSPPFQKYDASNKPRTKQQHNVDLLGLGDDPDFQPLSSPCDEPLGSDAWDQLTQFSESNKDSNNIEIEDGQGPSLQNRSTSSTPGAFSSVMSEPMSASNGHTRATSSSPTKNRQKAQRSSSLRDSSNQGSDKQEGDEKQEQRELFIYAMPLCKEKLVFLPVATFQDEEPPPKTGITGSINKLQESVTNLWQSMGSKDPGTFQHKIYQHGQAVLENMTAEERLMRYIPKAATKVVVYHPTSFSPQEVQDQLQKMTSNFLVKATGKAAAAGLLLPVAVGIEMIAVPGAGWFALYQLYKAGQSAKGVTRLNQYLTHAKNVRVCYAALPKLDVYVERSRLSPDGLLTQDDIDDLCHEVEQPSLQHPLTELRQRYVKRVQQTTGDYALLPAADAADEDSRRGFAGGPNAEQAKNNNFMSNLASQLTFWK